MKSKDTLRKKNLFTNILLLFVSMVISFLALEQFYRFYLFGIASFSIEKMNSINGLGELGLLKESYNSEIIYELKPNINTYHKLVELKTNSAGLRDQEYSISKTGNVYRIAVIGDSFTMADGVAINETFHSLLEEKLNEEQRDITYQFINFGVSGYSLRQYLGVMESKAIDYDPDLFLVVFCPRNDQNIPEKQGFREVPRTYPFFHSYSIDAIRDIYYRGTYYDDDVYYMKKELVRNAPFSDAERRYITRVFSEMDSLSKQNNIPIVIMYLDVFYNEKYAMKLEEIVLKQDLYFLNASLPFKEQEIDDYIIYPIDSHPNAKAHRIFADVFYEYLFLDENRHLLNSGSDSYTLEKERKVNARFSPRKPKKNYPCVD